MADPWSFPLRRMIPPGIIEPRGKPCVFVYVCVCVCVVREEKKHYASLQ